jgi:pre-mRNA-splicing factor CWC26
MPSDLASYLAENYLVADPNPKSKKRKRKDGTESGLLINDDDETGWSKSTSLLQRNEDGDGPVTVAGSSAEFRRAKKSNWKTVGEGGAAARPNNDDAAAADAILASAAAENEAAREADDEMPVLDDAADAVKMSDGTHAGLQSAATVSAQLRKRQREEREEFGRMRKNAKEEETIYRDATGRRVDVSMKRAEARRAAADAEDKELKAKEALKGDVQVQEARRRREQLEEAKFIPLARRADDEEMNRELKEQQRWNDPMAQFVSEKRDDLSTTKSKKAKRRPVYTGSAQPNRYGIRPGYRWDGVDRGNGFEAERFKQLNRRERNKGLEYSWQMDE